MLQKLLLVGTGGFIGAILRFLLTEFGRRLQPQLPIGTLIANISGTFLLAFILFSILQNKWFNDDHRLFLGVGLCGALTTMSSFIFESHELFHLKGMGWAMVNIFINLIACFAALLLAKASFSIAS